MGFFRRDKDKDITRDNDGPRPTPRSPIMAFLSGFNCGAVTCAALPLLILLINSVREGGGRMDWLREDGALARGCAYLWSLATCAALVRFVNGHAGRVDPRSARGDEGGVLESVTKMFDYEGDRGIDGRTAKMLVVALAMFANLCLLCALLICGVGEGGAEGLGRSIAEGQFVGTMFLTFILWLAWSLWSSLALHRIAKGGRGSGSRDDDDNMGYWAT